MTMRYQLAEPAPSTLLAQLPELIPALVHVLAQRNIITEADIAAFLHPDYLQNQYDPFLFQDMPKVVQRILQARDQQQKVLVFGDYDADGVCAAVLLYSALKQIGITDLRIYLPHRDLEGYGLNEAAIKQFVQEQVQLIITVDCGISNLQEINLAKQHGIDVIITDHHVEPPQLPTSAYAIINPQIKTDHYPFAQLAGVGVAFKVVQALSKTLALGEAFEKWLLDLVAISTVTDCMPLLNENRTLVKYGLIVLNKTKRLGLKSLLQTANLDKRTVTTTDIGYRIGPWINAAGRMDHANMAVALLLADNETDALKYAKQLQDTNNQRQQQTERMFNEAKQQLQTILTSAPVLYAQQTNWPLGLVGLVAGKLVGEYNKPAFVLTRSKEHWSGSGRSVTGFNMIKLLQSLEELFVNYGGHAMACGFTLKPEITIEQFCTRFNDLAKPILQQLDPTPTLTVAAKLNIKELNWDLINQLEQLQPYGEGNPEPCFLIEQAIIKDLQCVGTKQQHVKLWLADELGNNIKAIAFNQGEQMVDAKLNDKINIISRLGVNRWNGNQEIQITVQHIL
ncbi:MAG: single-stranded-DNA-specific exonuclease RecJ [Patescibacteria group bacterium]|jgi:single-stranded-DNA-specific exonuclease